MKHDGYSEPVATDIPDANSKVTLLNNGDAVLMLHNPGAETGWHNHRSLELWVSRDGCRTWPVRTVLARTIDADRVICYPDGFIDSGSECLHVAMDTAAAHYYMSIPLCSAGLKQQDRTRNKE